MGDVYCLCGALLCLCPSFGSISSARSRPYATIAAGADLNLLDTQGRTVLQRAQVRGQHEVVAALQRAGAQGQ